MGTKVRSRDVVIASAAKDSAAIDISESTYGSFLIPATITGSAVTFKTSPTLGGTYLAVADSTGTTLTVTNITVNEWQPLPAGIMAFEFIKIVADAQAGPRILTVLTKES